MAGEKNKIKTKVKVRSQERKLHEGRSGGCSYCRYFKILSETRISD